MRLNNVYRLGCDGPGRITTGDGKIIADNPNDELQINFSQALVFPGLINSHDHLDFNLFPQFGDRIYNNYVEWGDYIHSAYAQQIAEGLAIPKTLRALWGVYKNLLCGVTTVVNHGQKPDIRNTPITVLEAAQSLHSVQLTKRWRAQLNNLYKKNVRVAIHIGEGTDRQAHEEIDELISWNLLRREIIAVHGVAMTASQAAHFAALVWCPQTNYYLLNKTAAVDQLKQNLPILFGTDSTLTGHWNIWKHLRQARKTDLLTDQEIINSLSTNPALTWQKNIGKLDEGYDADIVVARLTDKNNLVNSFFLIDPADILLVVHKGHIRLFDEQLYSQLSRIVKGDYSKIEIDGVCKYVFGDLYGLVNSIKTYQPAIQFPFSHIDGGVTATI